MSAVEVARCPRCGQTKAVAEFSPDRSKANGRKSACRACDAASSAAYRATHLEQERARQRDYHRRRRSATQPGGDPR